MERGGAEGGWGGVGGGGVRGKKHFKEVVILLSLPHPRDSRDNEVNKVI